MHVEVPSGKKIGFHRIILFLSVSSFIIGGMCSQNIAGLSLLADPFCFPFVFLSYPPKAQ